MALATLHGNDLDVSHLVWMDVETTGLDAHSDLLLEVAVLITDLSLTLLDDEGFHARVLWPADTIAAARTAVPQIVRDMHDRTGLWDDVTNPAKALTVSAVDDLLHAYITDHVPTRRAARMAGSSLRLDLSFAEQFLPHTAGHLHYRMYDVTSIDLLVRRHLPVPATDKVSEHTAMSDIRDSIEQARTLDAALAAAISPPAGRADS